MSRKLNNVINEIREFIREFCKEVEITQGSTVNIEDCFWFDGILYYIPEETSLMDEDDAMLAKMLLATFPLEV